MKRLLLSLLLFSGAQMLFGAAAQDAILAREIEKLEQNNNKVNKVRAVLEGRECSVCMGPVTDLENAWSLPQRGKDCGHVFHKGCISQWSKQKLTCPLCNVGLAADDVPSIPETPVDIDAMTDEWNPSEGFLFLGNKDLGSVLGFNDFTRASEIISLNINNNPIRTLPAGAFEKYINLEKLSMGETQLKNIDENAFKGLGGLKELGLHELRLGSEDSSLRITKQMLAPLCSLETLMLDENDLKTLPEWAQTFMNLKRLDLQGNQLELTENTFSSFSELENLDLEGNRLRSLPDDIFKDNPLLKTLDLSENEFTAFPSAIRSLLRLQALYLSENKLELTEDTLKPFFELQDLDLSYNDLKTIPAGMLDELFLLKDLRLTFNKLERLPVGTLKYLTRLVHLDLVGNNFSLEEQERIRKEVVSPDCQVFFTPEDKAINLHGLVKNRDGDWVDEYGNRFILDDGGSVIGIGNGDVDLH